MNCKSCESTGNNVRALVSTNCIYTTKRDSTRKFNLYFAVLKSCCHDYCKLRGKLQQSDVTVYIPDFLTARVVNCLIYKRKERYILAARNLCVSEILNIYISRDGNCRTATALPITRCRICKRYDARNWSSEFERPRRPACSSAPIVCQLDLIGYVP
jgi:hypothetical protein